MRRTLIVALLLGVLAVAIVPAYGWVIPPNPAGEDSKYELYGPHVKGIIIRVYADTTTEWTDMNNGHLDIEDWPLDSAWVTFFGAVSGPFTEANYGGEAGYYILDINNNATYSWTDAGPFVHNPTSELPLRQAIAYAVNRSYLVQFTGGQALPIYTPMPTYMTGYINLDIAPGHPAQALTYSDLRNLPASAGNCDLEAANAILDANGYTIDGSGWRIDPVSQGGTGAELNLIFYSRNGIRGDMGDNIAMNLMYLLHIKNTGLTVGYTHVPRAMVTGPVLAQEYFNLYTGIWTGYGPDPDYLCDLYNGSNYYHPGSPPNYDGINYPETNANATTIKLAPTVAIGTQATLDFQYWFAHYAAAVPLWSYSGVKAYKNVPVDMNSTGNWTDLVNQKGFGVNSWWSTLDMEQEGNLYPNSYANYGFSSTVTLQNIVYAQWYWDLEVLGKIYDCGARRDPMTLASWVPQLYKNWTMGTWTDPSTHEVKASVTITLRPDVCWQDGQPVTIADVNYTLVEISKDLLAKGFPPPWWYPTVQYMRSADVIDDYNIRILLDVNSAWAVGWVIGSTIIPEHIWKPIVDASISPSNNPVIQGVTPDANIIGTGPFRWVSGVGAIIGDQIVLKANTPGSLVHGITSPGYYQYYPVYVDINPDRGLSGIAIGSNATEVISNVTITSRNLWWGGSLNLSKYVYVDGVLQPGHPIIKTLATYNMSVYPNVDAADVELEHFTLATGVHYVKVAEFFNNGTWAGNWVNATLPLYVNTVSIDVAVSRITTSESAVIQGCMLTVSVTATNYGETPEYFWLAAYADQNTTVIGDEIVIGNQTVRLAGLSSALFSFPWNTTGVPVGGYTISAEAQTLPGDTNPNNNRLTDGTVQIIQSMHDVAVTDIRPSQSAVYVGDFLSVDVDLLNKGNIAETVNLTLYADANTTVIGDEIVVGNMMVDLGVFETTTTTFAWDTLKTLAGNYTLTACASPVPGEVNLADNNMTRGTVQIFYALLPCPDINVTCPVNLTLNPSIFTYDSTFQARLINIGNVSIVSTGFEGDLRVVGSKNDTIHLCVSQPGLDYFNFSVPKYGEVQVPLWLMFQPETHWGTYHGTYTLTLTICGTHRSQLSIEDINIEVCQNGAYNVYGQTATFTWNLTGGSPVYLGAETDLPAGWTYSVDPPIGTLFYTPHVVNVNITTPLDAKAGDVGKVTLRAYENSTGAMIWQFIYFASTDNSPPNVENVELPKLSPDGYMLFNTTVSDHTGIDKVILHSAINGGPWQNTTMQWDSGDTFNSTTYTCKDYVGTGPVSVQYYVSAVNWLGNETDTQTQTISTIRDIAITGFSLGRTVVFEGGNVSLSAMVANQGTLPITFVNLALYANSSIVATETLFNIQNGTSTTLNFSVALPKGIYTIALIATPLPNETTDENNIASGIVRVSMVGDLTGGTPNPWDFVPDGKCDGKDIAVVARCYGSKPGSVPPEIWNANCDVNNDGKCDGKDIAIVARHYGEKDP
jgi:ABC-type transport system substrate-binding protein